LCSDRSDCSKGEHIRIKAHHGTIEIDGMAVATVNDQLQLQKVDIWFDPMAMFRQMKPDENTLTVKQPEAKTCPMKKPIE
jgi:hypothetical protein